MELARATDEEKQSQLQRLAGFKQRNAKESAAALQRLQQTALSGGNVFGELMHTVRFCSLGQITQALYAVGGQYRQEYVARRRLRGVYNLSFAGGEKQKGEAE